MPRQRVVSELPLEVKVHICNSLINASGDCREAHTLSKGWRQAALQATSTLRLDPARLRLPRHRDLLVGFPSLTKVVLNLRGYGAPTPALAWLADAPHLTSLDILGATDEHVCFLDCLSGLSELNLSYPDVDNGADRGGLTWLPPLDSNSSLHALNLSGTHVKDVGPLSQLRLLEVLNLRWTDTTSLVPLSRLTCLTRLDVTCCDEIQCTDDLYPLSCLASLRNLSANDFFAPMTVLTRLTLLSLNYGGDSGDVPSLALLTRLRRLSLIAAEPPPTYTGLSGLTYLDVERTEASSLQGMSLCSLVELHVKGNPVEDLTPLTALSGLKVLDISGTSVSDIRPLKLLSSLTKLHMVKSKVCDGTPLTTMPNLMYVKLQ